MNTMDRRIVSVSERLRRDGSVAAGNAEGKPMNAVSSPYSLTEDQLRRFDEDGFLAIERLIDPADLDAIAEEYAARLGDLADELHRAGRISSAYADLPFGARYAAILQQAPDLHRHFNISLPLINGPVDPATYHMHAGRAVFDLLRHPRILDAVESVLGPEIASSPVQQMRMKVPDKGLKGELAVHSNVGVTTWHQDIVALLPEADDTQVLTVWLALTDATVENGCLVSVRASHRDGPRVHCANAELASEPNVPERLLEDREVVPLPVSKGGVVLFNKMNVHRSLPNKSDGMRWSMDLRYTPAGQPSGRPAFPGFVARSRANPASELRDYDAWVRSWDAARERIVSGRYPDRVFEDIRWNDEAVC